MDRMDEWIEVHLADLANSFVFMYPVITEQHSVSCVIFWVNKSKSHLFVLFWCPSTPTKLRYVKSRTEQIPVDGVKPVE